VVRRLLACARSVCTGTLPTQPVGSNAATGGPADTPDVAVGFTLLAWPVPNIGPPSLARRKFLKKYSQYGI
jgi:hypothetical protein